MPNGRSIGLERQQGADAGGYSGLSDEVDNHWKQLIGAALLSTLLSVGSEVNAGANPNTDNATIIQALRQGFGNAVSQTGQQLVRQQMNIQPTSTVRPGLPVRVIVNRERARAAQRVGRQRMKLKIPALPDEKPVKINLEIPAVVHRDLLT